MSEQEPRMVVGIGNTSYLVVAKGQIYVHPRVAEYIDDLESHLTAALAAKEEAEQREREADAETRHFAGRNAELLDINQQLKARLAASEARAAALEAKLAIAVTALCEIVAPSGSSSHHAILAEKRAVAEDALTAIAAKTGSEDQAGQEDRG